MGVTAEKRRQYGSGSISQRSSDGRWVGAIMAGWTPAGTRRRVTVTALTEAECKRKLERKKGEIARNGVSSADTRTTVKKWADQWLEITQPKVRPKTWANNRSSLKQHIVPAIGHRRLEQLNPGDMRAVIDYVINTEGLTLATATRARAVLLKMLKDATLEGHNIPQWMFVTEGLGKLSSDRDAIPTPTAIALLERAAELPDGSRWVAAFLQGMRQGECLGLTWQCVDLERKRIDISWQLQAVPYVKGRAGALRIPRGYEHRQLEGALCLVRPKTDSSQRVIPLVPWMHAALTAWQQQAPASPHDLVWPRADGHPTRPDADTAQWHALQDAAHVTHSSGRRYLIHEIRHTCATLLLESGVDPETVTAILGHSSIVTSRGYQHVSTILAERALEAVAARLQLG